MLQRPILGGTTPTRLNLRPHTPSPFQHHRSFLWEQQKLKIAFNNGFSDCIDVVEFVTT